MDSVRGVVKKRRIRKFRTSWLDENIFKGWLTHDSVNNKALCIACDKVIETCCKTDLVKHSQTARHIENINSSNFKAIDNINFSSLSHKEKVKRVEIKL